MIEQLSRKDENGDYVISIFHASTPSRTVLFAAGAGGDPFRHRQLLTRLAEQGLTVIAPQFGRLANSLVGTQELAQRFQRLEQAFDLANQYQQKTDKSVAALGHSLGATMLIGLAGGHLWTRDKSKVDARITRQIDAMVLLAPALDFFRAPGALSDLNTSVQVWAGSRDSVTPATSVGLLERALGSRCRTAIIDGAGHFSFMDEPPPHIVDPMEHRDVFLEELAESAGRYLLG